MEPPRDLSPSAKGDLVKTPLAHLLVFVAERKLNGSLVLHGDDGSASTVFFVGGAPAKVQTSYPGTHLARVLLQLGFIDDDTMDSTLKEALQTCTLHGQVLLTRRAIDEAQLVAGLREQMMRRLLKLFEKLGDLTTYAFYADTNLLSDYGGAEVTPIDPFRVVWEGMHLRPNDPSIDPTLGRLGSVAVGVNARADLRRFGFGPPELKVLELLGVRPMSLAQVLDLNVMPVRQLKLLMYVLLITKSIEVVAVQTSAEPARPRQHTDPNVQAPRARMPSSPEQATQRHGVPMARVKLKKTPAAAVGLPAEAPSELSREDVLARAAEIDGEDYFQVLGITKEDPPDVARSAYFALAKKWHPDRLPNDLAEVRDDAARVFARISEAFQTLSDGEKRAKYLDLLERGSPEADERAKVQQVIEATIEYQKAEVYLRKREYDKALKSALRAYEGDPEQAHHVALYAWVLSQQPATERSGQFDESLSLLDRAVKLDDRCVQSFFYRAMLHKRMGRMKAALRDFRTVVELNPRHIDATREVRLATMRGAVADEPPKKPKAKGEAADSQASGESINWTQDSVSDIFGKLFKKK